MTSVVFKKRVRKGAPLSKTDDEATTNTLVDDAAAAANDDERDANTADADNVVKRARALPSNGLISKSAPTTAPSTSMADSSIVNDLSFASSRSAAPAGSSDAFATATYIVDGEVGERLAAEQRRAAVEAEARAAGPLGDGVFRGEAGFAKFFPDKEKDKPKAARRGPQTASAYARVATVMDYAMPICKDWKERGVCGYGDNCIYLHDRTDYKSGWQLDRDYEEALKKKEGAGGDGATANDADDDKGEYYIGSDDEGGAGGEAQCPICKNALEAPVEAKCGHRFCAKCVRKRVAKGKLNCAQCGQPTNGIFNAVKQQ
jgi:RING finger protein 113A